uniref:Cortactin n=1 Tax=Sus scrofa TaxID=9823 RepID=A0A8D1VMK0_PIG
MRPRPRGTGSGAGRLGAAGAAEPGPSRAGLDRPQAAMWKASAGHTVSIAQDDGGADDWETDPDFVNDVSEKEQRWGAKTVQGSGHQEHINIHKLRENVFQEHQTLKEKELETGPRASHGYGGKFGVEQDRMDKSAVGHEYQSKLSKHCSQVDSVRGFGGKFGVQVDRVDQSAVGFEYQGKTEKHASQKDYASGFGGKYGVQSDRVDKSAVGFDYQGKTEKHESQKDYSKGFGGKYGIDKDKVDRSAVGFEYQGKTEKHESQKDYVKGFGGKFGVQTDRQDKCALGWDHQEKLQLHESQKDYKTGFGGRFGVQSERQDSCAVGFDYKEKLAKHESQQDYSRGFGGKYGVQKDRMDKNASTFEDVAQVAPTYQKTVPVEAVNSKTSNIRANFENLAKEKEQEDRRKAEAERAQRMAKERQEQEEARRQLEEQARAQKPTPPASPTPQPAPERPPSSPVYEDAAPLQAEPSYRAPESTHEPEPVYSVEAAGYREACAPEAVYESTEAPGHYPAEEGAYDEYENDLGITAIALYDYQAGEKGARAPRGRAAAVPPSLPHPCKNGDLAAFSKLLERVNAVQRVPGFPSLNRLRAAGCPVPLKSPNRDTATEAVSSKSAESLLRPPHLQRPSRLPPVPRTLWSWSCLGLAPVPSHPTRSSPPAAPCPSGPWRFSFWGDPWRPGQGPASWQRLWLFVLRLSSAVVVTTVTWPTGANHVLHCQGPTSPLAAAEDFVGPPRSRSSSSNFQPL